MTPFLPLFGALAAAWAAVTVLHLRSRPRGGAAPFPSFQHLVGLAPRRRPAWPLEEPLRWLLRVLALGLVALALLLARQAVRRPTVILVEPGTPAWNQARSLVAASSAPVVALSFEGDRPVVESTATALESAERARRTAGSCSETTMACLVRAAAEMGGDPVVVSGFALRRDTFEALGSFRYVRSSVVAVAQVPSAPDPVTPGSTRVTRLGNGAPARIWAAALETAASAMGGGATDVTVVDRAGDEPANAGVVLVPVAAAGPSARAMPVAGVLLPDDAALAAGVSAIDVGSSLALEVGAPFRPVVPPILARSGRTILAAGTEEDLGRWAHAPALLALARVVLFEAGRGVTRTEPAPGGANRWSANAPVGLADVAPGRYTRDDGRVSLDVSRESTVGVASLTDAEIAAHGGTRINALPAAATTSPWPLGLLLAALALRLADAPRGRRPAVGAFVATVVLILVLVLDGSIVRSLPVRRVVETAGRLSLPGGVRDESCARPASSRPCVITARAAFADDLARGAGVAANAVVFPADRPRVDIVSWELPSEIRLGDAGLLRVTVDVRRAAGREMKLSARPTGGPAVEAVRTIASGREVATLSVPLRAAAEGISFALVRAAVDDDADAVVVPLVTRAHEARRLVLAAAPGWDARAAGEALAKQGSVERITRVGATAVLSRGVASATPLDPLARLSGDLSTIDLVVLAGFSSAELSGAREAVLARYVREGGALLFLGEPPRLAALPLPAVSTASAEESVLPSRVTASLGERRSTFLGFGAWRASLPPAGVVLGRLDGVPWIVGRGVGKGRLAAFAAPDPWRAGPDYEALVGDVVSWLEAGRSGPSVTLAPDLRSLSIGDERVPLPASTAGGLAVDPVDPMALLPAGRAKARVEARRRHAPFLEVDSAAELTSLLARIPEPQPLPRRMPARDANVIWLGLAALLVLEVWLRRRAA